MMQKLEEMKKYLCNFTELSTVLSIMLIMTDMWTHNSLTCFVPSALWKWERADFNSCFQTLHLFSSWMTSAMGETKRRKDNHQDEKGMITITNKQTLNLKNTTWWLIKQKIPFYHKQYIFKRIQFVARCWLQQRKLSVILSCNGHPFYCILHGTETCISCSWTVLTFALSCCKEISSHSELHTILQ